MIRMWMLSIALGLGAIVPQGQAQDKKEEKKEKKPAPVPATFANVAYGKHERQVLDFYKAESAEVHVRPDLALPLVLGERSLPGGPILLVGLILALCGYGTWYYWTSNDRTRPERDSPRSLLNSTRFCAVSANAPPHKANCTSPARSARTPMSML